MTPAAAEQAPQPTGPAGSGAGGWQTPRHAAAAEHAAPQPPAPDRRWQVQSGRFGRRNQQPAQPPAAAAPPPKPAPRREPPPRQTFDDDDDYENQNWLR
ncbi:hypothetical protein ACFQ0O_34935 [Saccharopolyspora spinosporotrichia]